MARQAQNQANQVFNTAQEFGGTSMGNANQLFNTLMPAYQQEAINPQGYTPSQKASMDTASQQSTGGAVAGAVGQGNLMGARDRNAGSFAPALDASARRAASINSENALGVENKSADLAEKKRQAGLAGLTGLYDTTTSDALKSLGLENEAINAGVEAGKSGWYQNTLGAINAITGAGKAASDLGWKPFET